MRRGDQRQYGRASAARAWAASYRLKISLDSFTLTDLGESDAH